MKIQMYELKKNPVNINTSDTISDGFNGDEDRYTLIHFGNPFEGVNCYLVFEHEIVRPGKTQSFLIGVIYDWDNEVHNDVESSL